MHTYHAETIVQPDGRVTLPHVPFAKGEKVDVVVTPSSEAAQTSKVMLASDEEAWRRLAVESFFRDYDERDSIYDSY